MERNWNCYYVTNICPYVLKQERYNHREGIMLNTRRLPQAGECNRITRTSLCTRGNDFLKAPQPNFVKAKRA